MKTTEFKLRIFRKLNCLVDDYFPGETMGERFINATLKIIVKNNIDKADSMLGLFSDSNGEIDAKAIINDYATQFGDDKLTFNLKDYVNNPTISQFLPDRALILTKKDLFDIINETVNSQPNNQSNIL